MQLKSQKTIYSCIIYAVSHRLFYSIVSISREMSCHRRIYLHTLVVLKLIGNCHNRRKILKLLVVWATMNWLMVLNFYFKGNFFAKFGIICKVISWKFQFTMMGERELRLNFFFLFVKLFIPFKHGFFFNNFFLRIFFCTLYYLTHKFFMKFSFEFIIPTAAVRIFFFTSFNMIFRHFYVNFGGQIYFHVI